MTNFDCITPNDRWNMEILDKESAFIFIRVEATVKELYDTHNHLDKRIL